MGLLGSIFEQVIANEAVDALETKTKRRRAVKKKRWPDVSIRTGRRKSTKKRMPPRTASGRFRKRRKARR